MTDCEFFQLLHLRWNVTRAKQIACSLPVQQVYVHSWSQWLQVVSVNDDHVGEVDLTEPIILVRIRKFSGAAMVIDGWHRLTRALRDGVSTLPCVVLDEDQEAEIRVFED